MPVSLEAARSEPALPARPRGWLLRLGGEFAPQDWLVLAYFVVLNGAVLLGERSPIFTTNVLKVSLLGAFALVSVVLVRSERLPDGWFKAFLYRLAIYAPVQISYFMFREILPAVNPGSLDAVLAGLDQSLFGLEPALALDAWVTPAVTEWFAFFYFGYFVILLVHIVPLFFLARDQRLAGEFTLGMLIVFCIGHTLYMLVPGFGPYVWMKGQFEHELPPGLWLTVVVEAVRSGGALKDIFPSLHTAAPTFVVLYAFRHRHRLPFGYTWPILAFFACNIMVATLFLRWHYLIDVVAGLLLSAITILVVPPAVDFELARRARLGLSPLWPRYTR